ncbi:MAG: Xaa-Pro aminopeptidase [Pyrinomonadaceae bacterium]
MPRPQLTEFMKRIGDDAVAIVPSARETVRSNDTHYRYRQDSDLFYLSGFSEPESIAVVKPSDKDAPYTLFVRPRDPEREIWDGRRAGVEGAVSEYGADAAHTYTEFAEKVGELMNNTSNLYYRIGVDADLDQIVIGHLRRLRALGRKGFSAPHTIIDTGAVLHEMRLIKSDEEIANMQRAADISAAAHVEAMKTARGGMKEFEIEALLEFSFRKNGAAAPAYTSIVGAGANATVLHYIENSGELHDGELLLIDAGAEFNGYAADITRTFPINGKFNQAQREIYDLVLEAQVACCEMVRPGSTNDEIKARSVEILTDGLVRLGLLKGEPAELIKEEKYKQFYMHGLGHYLGLDVHDVGRYYHKDQPRRLEPGMVMTVEPGIYISPDTKDIPSEYLGIGVRIEDDVLVTKNGPRVLTDKVPKTADEIEAVMAR